MVELNSRGDHDLTVVPAKAGTHTPRLSTLRRWERPFAASTIGGYEVPAFAGTTIEFFDGP